MKFLTSDLHFGHANIAAYTGRPYYSVQEMNDDMVARWNAMVSPGDQVWVLGDVALGKLDESLQYVGLLNGEKYLVPGNHDRMFGCQGDKWQRAAERYLGAGFSAVANNEVWLDGLIPRRLVLATHFPYAGDSRHDDRYVEHRPQDRGGWLVHGHTHGLWRRNGRMIDVGVDAWGGYPVAFAQVTELAASEAEQVPRLQWV